MVQMEKHKLSILIMEFRSFLANNKIIFETVMAALLSIMAILVSINSNKIARLQAKLTEIQVRPSLQIDFSEIENKVFIRFGIDKEGRKWVTYNLKILNQGGSAVYNFKIDEKFFLFQGVGDDICREIGFNDLNPKNAPFPYGLEKGSVHTVPMLVSKSGTNEDDFNKIYSSLSDGYPIGVKILVRYFVEGFPDKEREEKIVYSISPQQAMVHCRLMGRM